MMRHDTVKEAEGKWLGILTACGIDAAYLRNKAGPCPICEGRDRFRWDNKDGKGTFYCNGCGAGNGMRLLMLFTGLPFKEAAKKVDSLLGAVQRQEAPKERDPTPRLREISKQLVACDGITPVRLYLRNRCINSFPEEFFRLHPSLEYYDAQKMTGRHPAMVARISDVLGKFITYHVTYLTASGHKANVEHAKKIMQSKASITGGAIRLSQVKEHIALAEGIETALAVRQLFGVECWATVNATLMEQFNVPDGVKSITIYADNDSSFTGQKAAYVLANRLYLKNRNISVKVEVAPHVDADFADILAGAAARCGSNL